MYYLVGMKTNKIYGQDMHRNALSRMMYERWPTKGKAVHLINPMPESMIITDNPSSLEPSIFEDFTKLADDSEALEVVRSIYANKERLELEKVNAEKELADRMKYLQSKGYSKDECRDKLQLSTSKMAAIQQGYGIFFRKTYQKSAQVVKRDEMIVQLISSGKTGKQTAIETETSIDVVYRIARVNHLSITKPPKFNSKPLRVTNADESKVFQSARQTIKYLKVGYPKIREAIDTGCEVNGYKVEMI